MTDRRENGDDPGTKRPPRRVAGEDERAQRARERRNVDAARSPGTISRPPATDRDALGRELVEPDRNEPASPARDPVVRDPVGPDRVTDRVPPVVLLSDDQDPSAAFAELESAVPLLLLPVRLETRFTGSASALELKVRIYPDQIHLDDHARGITAEEAAIGRAYWEAWHRAGNGDEGADGRQAARDWLASRLEPRRAAWVARQTEPTVLRDGSLDFPSPELLPAGRQAEAACLPARWGVVGYTLDEEENLQQRFVAWGKPIAEDLKLSVQPEDLEPWSDAADALPVDEGLAWMVDYGLAVDKGMAITVDLRALEDVAQNGLALLLAVGVSERTPSQGGTDLADLLEAHNYTDGAAFLRQGTPTNNTDGADSGWSSRELDIGGLFARELDDEVNAEDEASHGRRLASALGIPENELLARLENATHDEESSAGAMNRVLWPVTWGQYFDHLLANEAGEKSVSGESIDDARRRFIEGVRGGSTLPSMRIGAQPYGVLPVRLAQSPRQWTSPAQWFEETLLFLRHKWVESLAGVPRLDPVLGATGGSEDNDPESVLVEILASLPHPKRFRLRDLRNWRRDSYDTEWAILLALFGLVFLAGKDPTYGHDALSVLGRWGWARHVLGSSDFLGIPEAELRPLDNARNLEDADAQIAALRELRGKVASLVGAGQVGEARDWIDYMIGQVQKHKARQPPLNEMGTAPIDLSGVLADSVDDPKIVYSLYGDDAETRVWNRELVESPEAGPGETAFDYLTSLRDRVPVLSGETIEASPRDPGVGSRPEGGPFAEPTESESGGFDFRPVATDATPSDRARPRTSRRALRSTRGTAARRVAPSERIGISRDTGRLPVDPVVASPSERTDDDLPPTFHADEPLLYQLLDAVVDDVPSLDGATYRSALDTLRQLPVDELELRLRETLGLATHRLDAWTTSIARERLGSMRDERPTGLQLGGFGWVVDLVPDAESASQSQGFVFTPSLPQATTAAILRAGWSTHGTEEETSTLAVDLRASRLRLASWLLDGIRQGQPLGALLGYRFERRLHDEGLDDWIDPCRRAVLEDQGLTRSPRGSVDGLDLVELHQASGLASVLSDATADGDGETLKAALDNILEALDAVGDASIAESVHQVAQGNMTRAAATLDALSLGEVPPPKLRHPDTLRTGVGITHRVLVLLAEPPSNGLRAGTGGWMKGGPRATFHPALESWADHVLQPAGDVVCTVTLVEGAGGPGSGSGPHRVSMGELQLSALDAAFEAPAGELEGDPLWARRVRKHALDRIAGAAGHGVVIEIDFDGGELESHEVSFQELAQAARALRRLLGNARALDSRDLVAPDTEIETGWDVDELEGRVAVLEQGFRAAIEALRALLPVESEEEPHPVGTGDLADLQAPMLGLSYYALAGAIPGAGWLGDEEDRAMAYEQAWSLFDRATARVLQLDQLKADWTTTDGASSQIPTESERIKRAQATVGVILARAFPVTPRFTFESDAATPIATFDRSDDLLASDPTAVQTWLQQVAKVRPEAAGLADLSLLSELLVGATRIPLVVDQLPLHGTEGWVARAAPSEGTGGRVSFVAADYRGTDAMAAREPALGLVVDEWIERVPTQTQTAGVAFHFDSPASRAPQTMLLAVPPEGHGWDFELVVDTLRRTLEEAQLRAVGPETLVAYGHHLPAIFSPRRLDPGEQPDPTTAEEGVST